MRLASLLGVVVLALGVYASAAAEEGEPADRWVQAFQSEDGQTALFDALSVKRDAGIVTYWQRILFSTPQKLSGGQAYTEEMSEISTECGADWFTTKSVVLLDDKGQSIRQNDLIAGHAKLQPRSLDWNTQVAVCRFVARAAALKPVLIDSLGATPQWTPLGELKRGVTGDVSRASIRKRGGIASAAIRISYTEPSTSRGGYPFRTMYARLEIDCRRSSLREREADFVDDQGQLVDTRPASQGAEQFAEIPAGSIAVTVRRMACGEPTRQGGGTQVADGAQKAPDTPADNRIWVHLTTDSDGVTYGVDPASIRQHGAYVESWQKEMHPSATRLKTGGGVYTVVLSHVLDDCAKRASGNLAWIYKDASGKVVKTIERQDGEVTFDTFPPEGDPVQTYVCKHARQLASLKPNFSTDLFEKADWAPLGGSANYTDSEIARSTIERDGARSLYISRSRARPAAAMSDGGMPFQTVYEAWQIDCDLSTARMIAADYYDESGRLVDVTKFPDPASLPFSPVASAGPLAKAREIACAAAQTGRGQDDKSADDAEYASGTAWLGPKGYLVTASHVVKGATAIVVAQDGQPVGSAVVVADDPKNDVAILRPSFRTPALHPLIALSPVPVRLGEHVFTLGYPAPDDLGLSVKLTSGEVSSVKGRAPNGEADDTRLMQISTPVQPGNSGGPLLDDRGRAVGIVIAGFGADSGLQNVNYAIKIGYVRNLLGELPDLGGYRPLRSGATTSGLASDLRNSIFMLVVATEKEK